MISGRTSDYLTINPLIKPSYYKPHPRIPMRDRPLTPKQHTVMYYICQGYSQKQIAHILHIHPDSVKRLTYNIRTKLRAHNTTHAAVLYLYNLLKAPDQETWTNKGDG